MDSSTEIESSLIDDIALVTNSKPQLLIALNTLLGQAARTGLSINRRKAKFMVVLPKSDADNSYYLVAGNQIEVVDHFPYIGFIKSSDGCIDHEVTARTAKVSSVFGRLSHV